MKKVIADLGWRMVRLSDHNCVIMSPEDYSGDGMNQPAASIQIYGEENIRKLRDALTEALDGQP